MLSQALNFLKEKDLLEFFIGKSQYIMELANQVLYLSFGLIFLGLSFSAFQNIAGQDQFDAPRQYWAFSLVAMSLSCFFLVLYSLQGALFITLRNIFQVAVDVGLGLLFHSLNTRVKKSLLVSMIGALIILGGVFEYLRLYYPYDFRVMLLSSLGIALSIWQIYELLIHYKKSHSVYLGFIIFAISLQILLWLYRIWTIENYTDLIDHQSLLDEHLPEFVARLLLVVLYALIFIAISNYFYAQLINIEKQHLIEKGDQMLMALKGLAAARDNDTGSHLVRTPEYVKILAKRLAMMGYYQDELSDSKIEAFYKAAPLHDLGKVGIPDHILLKPGALTEDERVVMDTHSAIGETILMAAQGKSLYQDDVIKSAIEIAGAHHEKWDGTGYPRKLVGENIPLSARIMAVADMYDALITERAYKRRWSHQDAVLEIAKKKGSHFDPAVVEAFMVEQNLFMAIANKFKG